MIITQLLNKLTQFFTQFGHYLCYRASQSETDKNFKDLKKGIFQFLTFNAFYIILRFAMLRCVIFTFWKYYVLWRLRFVTLTFCDFYVVLISNSYVKWRLHYVRLRFVTAPLWGLSETYKQMFVENELKIISIRFCISADRCWRTVRQLGVCISVYES
jgi:hypothetical protein